MFSDNNTFLRIPFYINDSIDMNALGLFLKLFNHHFHRIRNFLVVIQQNLLTNDFRHKESGRFVRPLVLINPAMPGAELTVKELVALFGGIVYPNSYQPPMNYTPLQLEGLWQTMHAFTPKKWNRMLTNLAEFESRSKDKMHIRVNLDSLRGEIGEFDEKLGRVQILLEALRKKGVVLYRKDDHILDYKYTDPLYRYCTQKAGNTLEIKVLLEARSLKEQGCSFFTDCQTSVHIDWDGHVHKISDNIPDTNNEIDLILMHGVTPLFISCKNGDVEEEELYKLHTVAREFGGPNVRKMLVATSLSKHDPSHKALIRRAWDMDIYPVTGFTKFTSEDWQDTFRDALW